MGNEQSQPAQQSAQQPIQQPGIQLTHEQWQQYQLFMQNQTHHQQPVRHQPQPIRQHVQAVQQPVQQSVPHHLQRTQVKLTNNNVDKKIIPNMQQKSRLPNVENTFQDAYQQRLNDQFTMGGTRQMQPHQPHQQSQQHQYQQHQQSQQPHQRSQQSHQQSQQSHQQSHQQSQVLPLA